jgi:multiple sugar transport system permease protein
MYLQRRARFAYFLVLPALLVILLLDVFPIIEGVIVSVQNQNQMRPNPEAFVGARHYVRALTDQQAFWHSFGRSMIWTAFSVAGGYLVALGLALLLNMEIWGRGVFRALFLVPWVIPDVCTALVWKWLYGDEFGVINFLLVRAGVVDAPVLWLSNPNLAMASVILVQVWKLYPVMFIVLLAALQNVPRELHEAATIDGANMRQRFVYITMPFLKKTSVIITLLGCIWTFQAFDIIYLLTGGGPANATKTLPTLIYDKAFWGLEMGYAAAIAMLMLAGLLVFSVAYLLVYRSKTQAEAA